MDCGKEDRERERAMLSEMRSRERRKNPRAAQTSSLFPPGKRERCREPSDTAMASGWERLLATDSPVNGRGEGTWTGHKRDTQRGPLRAQKGETVPEEPLPAFPAVNSL